MGLALNLCTEEPSALRRFILSKGGQCRALVEGSAVISFIHTDKLNPRKVCSFRFFEVCFVNSSKHL